MKYRKIPRDKIDEGFELCRKNVCDFLDDAKLMIERGRLNHAFVSVQFAIEELGKILMLRQAFKNSKDDPLPVKDSVFKSHKGKSDKAWDLLNQKFKVIYDEGHFNDEGFNPAHFKTDTKASHRTRLDCAFVDWNGAWHIGRNIKEALLRRLIQHIEEKLSET